MVDSADDGILGMAPAIGAGAGDGVGSEAAKRFHVRVEVWIAGKHLALAVKPELIEFGTFDGRDPDAVSIGRPAGVEDARGAQFRPYSARSENSGRRVGSARKLRTDQ